MKTKAKSIIPASPTAREVTEVEETDVVSVAAHMGPRTEADS